MPFLANEEKPFRGWDELRTFAHEGWSWKPRPPKALGVVPGELMAIFAHLEELSLPSDGLR